MNKKTLTALSLGYILSGCTQETASAPEYYQPGLFGIEDSLVDEYIAIKTANGRDFVDLKVIPQLHGKMIFPDHVSQFAAQTNIKGDDFWSGAEALDAYLTQAWETFKVKMGDLAEYAHAHSTDMIPLLTTDARPFFTDVSLVSSLYTGHRYPEDVERALFQGQTFAEYFFDKATRPYIGMLVPENQDIDKPKAHIHWPQRTHINKPFYTEVMLKFLAQIIDTYDTKISFGREDKLYEALDKSDSLDLLIVGGHGEPDNACLTDYCQDEKSTLDVSDDEMSDYKDKFNVGAKGFLVSCSAAKGDGSVAAKLHEWLDIEVCGSDIDFAPETDLEFATLYPFEAKVIKKDHFISNRTQCFY